MYALLLLSSAVSVVSSSVGGSDGAGRMNAGEMQYLIRVFSLCVNAEEV